MSHSVKVIDQECDLCTDREVKPVVLVDGSDDHVDTMFHCCLLHLEMLRIKLEAAMENRGP